MIISTMSAILGWVKKIGGSISLSLIKPISEFLTTVWFWDWRRLNKWSKPFLKTSSTYCLSGYSQIVENKDTLACWWYGSEDCKIEDTELVIVSMTLMLQTLANASKVREADKRSSSLSSSFLFNISRHFMMRGSKFWDTSCKKLSSAKLSLILSLAFIIFSEWLIPMTSHICKFKLAAWSLLTKWTSARSHNGFLYEPKYGLTHLTNSKRALYVS